MSQAPQFEEWPSSKFKYPALSLLFFWRKSDNDPRCPYRDAKCMACGKISNKTKPERAVDHAVTCPMQDLYDDNALDQLKAQADEIINRSTSSTNSNDTEVDQLVTELIAVNLLPIRLVSSRELRNLVSKISLHYKLPNRKKFTNVMLANHAKRLQNAAMVSLLNAPNYSLTIECDCWTSRSNTSVIAVVITRHTGESTLVDLIDASDRRHTSENLVDMILPAVDATGIEKTKFNCMVTDEASNIRVARETICENFDGHLLHYRCMAHVFNLIIGHMCNSAAIKPHVKTLIDFINKISMNKFLLNFLKTSGANMPSKVVATRWYSTSSALNSILDLEEALETAIQNPDLRMETIKPTVQNQVFWRSLKFLKRYLDKLSEMIGKIEASNSRLSDGFHQFLVFLRFVFEELSTSTAYRDVAREAAIVQFRKIDLDLLLTAYALDPNYSMNFLTRYALAKVDETVLALLIEMGHDPSVAVAMKRDIERYKVLIKPLTPPINTWEWWRRSELTILRRVGLRLAACHGSSANTERIFSALSATITPSRNRLNLSTAFDLISLRINLLSRDKPDTRRRVSGSQLSQSDRSELAEEPLDSLEVGLDSLDIVDDNFESLASQQLELEETHSFGEFKKCIDFNIRPLSDVPSPSSSMGRVSSREQARMALQNLNRDEDEMES